MTCCSFVPNHVLQRFADDRELSDELRAAFRRSMILGAQLRRIRTEAAQLSSLIGASQGMTESAPPEVLVYTCNHGTTTPGAAVSNPGSSGDASAKRAFDETTGVAQFYLQIFGRNSLDNAGMSLISSIHYDRNFNNAFWNGTQMIYGDGDGMVFKDLTLGNDVIGHELTHGVTQHSLQLSYADQAGGLNESMSDVFGSMFRQWQAGQDAGSADWLIGHDIMGPKATQRGFTCLRDMSDPGAAHCLSPQPTHFSHYHNGMDPHESSGIPNLAFATIAKAVGGRSWDPLGKIWYRALTGSGSRPNMTMREFADATRSAAGVLYPGNAKLHGDVDGGWKSVGL